MFCLIAWRNLRRNPRRSLTTTIGFAVSVLLVIVQFGLLTGFIAAAEQIPLASGATLWVLPSGVPNLEFSSTLDVRQGERLRGISEVVDVQPLVARFSEFHSAQARSAITMIGVPDAPSISRLPLPRSRGAAASHWADPFIFDRSSSDLLALSDAGDEAEINDHRVIADQPIEGYASFLGSPYVFLPIATARRALGMSQEKASFLMVYLDPSADVSEVLSAARAKLTHDEILPAAEFAHRSSRFWLTRTGAGGGFLVSAFFGLAVGIVLVAQNLYGTTLDLVKEYATMRAIGMRKRQVARVVIWEAVICGIVGAVVGAAASFPAIAITRATYVPWIGLPIWLPPAAAIIGIVTAVCASLFAVRKVLSVDPTRVFRGG